MFMQYIAILEIFVGKVVRRHLDMFPEYNPEFVPEYVPEYVSSHFAGKEFNLNMKC